ncbi:carbamoyltransferase HypF [Clostridium sp. SHJSY1]|uniref:carbamoyltransferase HypF n=1 Tax=Clostridium sp. SHJSY1 TaxID=2942483 RepID=UPI002876FAD5|nr:carbamoyltransferase HypF [Clostridium sp. SHJSY1]MDS0527531.1 carbamoyltransferase HypF [Clostridium sp. SHJSY1]
MKRFILRVEGIVQGIGFRPFVYNIAIHNDIKGWINNNSEGVFIDIEGEDEKVHIFLQELKNEAPSLAKIEKLIIKEEKLKYYTRFEIKKSQIYKGKITLVSPDIATCEECIQEIKNPTNKRYKYPFTNCTNCGPRFSIIKDIPYDRDKTTMEEFKMCMECEEEYKNPLNRRFHAQPNACKECGPKLWIEDTNGVKVSVYDEIEWTRKKLKEGKIFAIKGLGGFHLVCDAADENAIRILRDRKKRPHKPFAVMMKNIEATKKYCKVSFKEEEVLTGSKRPIVILEQLANNNLSELIAPHQKTLGVMLPYTPLHHLLFEDNVEALIMTSANVYGLPLEYKNKDAIKNLGSIADYFLQHDRDIYVPIDDSVVKIVNDDIYMIRRARGYVPEPILIENMKSIFACGSNMKNTFCISKENFLFLSQHNGDLENVETIEHYENNIEHFKNIFSFKPDYIAIDMHPNYTSNKFAQKYNLPVIEVQHHHAHIVSSLAESGVNRKVIGIAFDGTGYGTDGKLWGGEFLLCDNKEFERLGHLEYIKMPGGEKAIKEPWRMGVSYIYETFKSGKWNSCNNLEQLQKVLVNIYGKQSINLLPIIDAQINCPETSSMGRLFDGVSSIIGLNHVITYEGQAAIELESLIKNEGYKKSYNYNINIDKGYVVEPYEIILGIMKDKVRNISDGVIATKFHNTIIKFAKEICNLIRKDRGINEVALSGGVFQNKYLLNGLIEELKSSQFIVYTNKLIPSNDGGIALGQIIIANEILNDTKNR